MNMEYIEFREKVIKIIGGGNKLDIHTAKNLEALLEQRHFTAEALMTVEGEEYDEMKELLHLIEEKIKQLLLL